MGRWRGWHPVLAPETLLLASAVAFSLFYNNAAWHRLFAEGPVRPADAGIFALLFLALTAVQFASLALIIPGRLVRPVLMLIFVGSAFASFFMEHFGIHLDADMLRNALQTDAPEARELLTVELGWHLLVYAVLPAVVLARVRVAARPWGRALARRAVAVVIALVIAGGAVFGQYKEISSLVRARQGVASLVTPANYLVSMVRVVRDATAAPDGPRLIVGPDAHRARVVAAGRRPQLLVIVVGETLRAANFGLSGYARQTTPELARQDLAVFPRVSACGTSTAVSVPCLFAPVGRRDYDGGRIARQESLLHVLQRAGLAVTWIDNQSGCKGVCADLPTEQLDGSSDPAFCDGEHCRDGILLQRLAAAAAQPGDRVVVLHMLGNHGPAYSRRYPPEFRRFTPACENLDLRQCSREEVVNAYDNAVLYTDHVLAGVLAMLEGMTDRNTGLIFVSDHGESLGENGLYLHGLPYHIAPAEQLEVPMLAWLSPGLVADAGIDWTCAKARGALPAAHDNLFHSVLGLLRVRTVAYEPALDLFAACRRQLQVAAAD